MTVTQAVTTMFGAFMFPFMILVWGRMVRGLGAYRGLDGRGFHRGQRLDDQPRAAGRRLRHRDDHRLRADLAVGGRVD